MATELITNPPIIFCDEPTTGLDSFLAEIVVESLSKLAENGTVVLCTIHQPSSKTFSLFTDLLLLAHGEIAYMGNRTGAASFFEFIEAPVPKNFNPCDHYLRHIAVVPESEDASYERIRKTCETFRHYSKSLAQEQPCRISKGLQLFR